MCVKRTANAFPLLGLGFFSLVAQSLLFRDVFSAFEYNELMVAAFYSSWLLWVGIGAWFGRWEFLFPTKHSFFFPLALLAYIPAFLLQHVLTINVRSFAGVQAYELFPLTRMLGLLFLLNSPVSFLTGFLFPVGCRWAEQDSRQPVSRVYALETLGACLGGLFVTLLLRNHFSGQLVFIILALVTVIGVLAWLIQERQSRFQWLQWLLLLVLVGSIAVSGYPRRLGQYWTRTEDLAAWARLLPADWFESSWSSGHARYSMGRRDQQWIFMTGGSVCESYPGGDEAAEVAAIHLAQQPDAREILVFGSNTLGVSAAFASLSEDMQVSWLHPDPEYTEALRSFLSKELPDNLKVVSEDFGNYVRHTAQKYDMVALCLPDVTTLSLNRFCTREFFAELEKILTPTGMVSVRVSGGANYLGEEVTDPGGVMLATLKEVFDHIVLKPGDDSWFMASKGGNLEQDPEILFHRYQNIPGAERLYPPEAIRILYSADRVQFQQQAYTDRLGSLPQEALINTDNTPKALKFGFFLALKQAEWRTVSRALRYIYEAGLWLFFIAIALYLLLRMVYRLQGRKGAARNYFDSLFLVFSTGLASMTFNMILIFLYQSRFGSLFLEIGLVTALFMFGGAVGSAGISILQKDRSDSFGRIMTGSCLLFHVLLLCILFLFPSGPKYYWFILFVLGGIFTGVYFPLAAKSLKEAQIKTQKAAARLEIVDTLGGAAGGFLTGVLLLPIAGVSGALLILGCLVLINLPPLFLPSSCTGIAVDPFAQRLRRWAYLLVGVACYALLLSQIAAARNALGAVQNLEGPARSLAGDLTPEKKYFQDASGLSKEYFSVDAEDASQAGYIFDSSDWAAPIDAYGGPLDLLIYISKDGLLRNYDVLRHRETPAYLRMVETEKGRLLERSLFAEDPFAQVDSVSGATITADAITQILENATLGFGREVLGVDVEKDTAPLQSRGGAEKMQRRHFMLLSAMAVVALLLRRKPGVWRRRALLLVVLVVAGLGLNLQYSLHHVLMLLSINWRMLQLTGVVFLTLLVPLFVLFFGNFYCGYLCPFGALQEFLGELVPKRYKIPEKPTWRYGRIVKYLLLFFLLMLFALTQDTALLQGDLLSNFFGKTGAVYLFVLGITVLLLSLVSPRFWCRNLCPTGAFLSLLNGVRLLRFWMPRQIPARCHLGVNTTEELDCIHCDQCITGIRHAPVSQDPLYKDRGNLIFLFCVAAIFWGCLMLSVSEAVPYFRSTVFQEQGESSGKPRPVDIPRMKRMIEEGMLSDHDAEFYSPR